MLLFPFKLIIQFFLFAQVHAANTNYAPASQQRVQRQPPDALADPCHSSGPWKPNGNCTAFGQYYYYDPTNRTCRGYQDCRGEYNNRFTSVDTCLNTCLGGRKETGRCRRHAKSRTPEHCHWVRARRSATERCPEYQLQCTGGPCASHPCNAPCEICTYNLEFTIHNCSLLNLNSDNGKICPPPFRCERDIRCRNHPPDKKDQLAFDTQSPAAPVIGIPPGASSTAPVPVGTDPVRQAVATISPSACFLPVKYIACATQDAGSKLIWYFDVQAKLCRRFYGTHTCSGNDNGFQTKEECVRVCRRHEGCPNFAKETLPLGCHYEERKTSDGCLSLSAVCTEKPGRCPLPTGRPNYNTRICYKECHRDSDCKDEMKCCANGCASLCVAAAPPLFPLPRVEEGAFHHNEKPGVCPTDDTHAINDQISGPNCSEKCEVDDDCSGRNKCCSMSICGRVCISLEETPHPHHVPHRPAPHHTTAWPSNPCVGVVCPPQERCTPLSPGHAVKRSPDQSPSYICQRIDALTHFDPCAHGKENCGSDELCIHEPQLCLTAPCAQYRCVPGSHAYTTSRRKDSTDSATPPTAKDMHAASDPCALNPCRPCQRCARVDLDKEGKDMDTESILLPYRCESHCGAPCEECGLNGHCVMIKQPHICKSNTAANPCQNRTCDAFPDAKCIQDPCHCLRAKFELESGTTISIEECRVSTHSIVY